MDDVYLTYLDGNVHFFYGETEFYSDKARINDRKKTAELEGNVEVYEDTLALYADKVKYFREKELIILRNNVFLKETHRDSTIRTFEAKEVDYLREKKIIEARDSVYAYDERENIHGYCGFLKYNQLEGYGYLIKKPIVYLESKDSLSLESEKIEYFDQYEKIVATFDVTTTYQKMKIYSDFAIFLKSEDRAIFLGEPEFHADLADAYSKRMQMFFNDDQIEKAILTDSSRVNFTAEENALKDNWITSDKMDITFIENRINSCEAFENVSSHYKKEKSKKIDFSINDTQGDYLKIIMDNENEVDMIKLKNNVKGVYKFKNK